MRHVRLRLLVSIAVVFLSLAFNFTFYEVARAAAQAQDQPTIVPFQTAHVRYEMRVLVVGEQVRFGGEGDIDAARNASRLTLQIPGVTSTEVIAIDGRTYVRDPDRNQWIYTDEAMAGSGLGLSGNAAVPDLSPFQFARVGPDMVGGAPATHWRANVDFAELSDQLGLDPEVAAQLEEVGLAGTIDIWVGNNDSYLHRFAINLQSSIPDPQTGQPVNFTIAMSMTFSNFNAPVQITAPANASPAPATGGAITTPSGRGGTGQSQPTTMPRSGGGGIAAGAWMARAAGAGIAMAAGAMAVLTAATGLIFRRHRSTSR